MAGQRGIAERGRAAVDEPERLAGVDAELRRRAGAALPGALAEQAQPGGGERGEVAGADRPVERHRRGEAAVDGIGQYRQQRRVHARAARAELVEPHHEHGAGHLGRQQRPGARGVAAQQPYPVLGQVALAEVDRVVGAHPGVPAVHRLPRGQVPSGQPGRPRRGHGPLADGHARLPPRHRRHRRAGQRRPVDDHDCAGHGSRPLPAHAAAATVQRPLPSPAHVAAAHRGKGFGVTIRPRTCPPADRPGSRGFPGRLRGANLCG